MIKCYKKNRINLSFFKKIVLSNVLLIVVGILPVMVQANSVSLYLSPSSNTYQVDDVFSVAVKVNSGGIAINASEGVLVFNPSELQVISISRNGSIFSLWTTEPSFSNSTGYINFGGGVPNSFIGNSGTIITINFKAKVNAVTQVNFSSGSVLAADGKGTNILGSMNGGIYVLKSEIVIPTLEEDYILPPTDGAPLAPIVTSYTHPNTEVWYSNNSPEFLWSLPNDITTIKLLLNNDHDSFPEFEYDSLITEKKIENVSDDTWYFHIRFKNQHGWGQVSHRKVLVDTGAPNDFKVLSDNGGDNTNPRPILYFRATDSVSGIKYYEVMSDGKLLETITNEDLPYQIPAQGPGTHLIEIKAFDKAGNFKSALVEIEIIPIEAPVITETPVSLKPGETLIIKGIASSPIVRLYLELFGKEPVISEVKVDENGSWVFTSPFLQKGDYRAWAQSKNEKGALSLPSREVNFWVGSSPFLRFGKIAIDYLSIMLTLVVLIMSLIGIMFYARNRFILWQKRVKREIKEAERSTKKAFQILQKKIEKEVEYLNNRKGLSKREKEIQDKLQEALDSAKETIDKEIKDIEKELKE